MKQKALLVSILLLLSFLVSLNPQAVHAANPVVDRKISQGGTGSWVSVTDTDSCPGCGVNEFLVVMLQSTNNNNNNCPTVPAAPTDGSDTFTLAIDSGCIVNPGGFANYAQEQWIYYGTCVGNGMNCIASVSVTWGTTGGLTERRETYFVWASGLTTRALIATATGNGALPGAGCSGNTITATTSVNYASSNSVIASEEVGIGQTHTTPGTGYTQITSTVLYSSAYGLSGGTVPNPTNFLWNINDNVNCGNPWGVTGATFGLAVPPTVVTVVTIGPCNFFQLQCWWYPLLFMGLYSGFFLFVAGVGKAPPRAAMHLFLTGLAFGALVAVILGIMNIVFPLMLLLINTLYVLRMRR